MASPTLWTWVWIDSGSWWWTGRPAVHGVAKSRTWLSNWTELKVVQCWRGRASQLPILAPALSSGTSLGWTSRPLSPHLWPGGSAVTPQECFQDLGASGKAQHQACPVSRPSGCGSCSISSTFWNSAVCQKEPQPWVVELELESKSTGCQPSAPWVEPSVSPIQRRWTWDWQAWLSDSQPWCGGTALWELWA